MPPHSPGYDIPQDLARWLAGVCEVGASLRFNYSRRRKNGRLYENAAPVLEFVDNDPLRIRSFQKLCGGRVNAIRRSWRWRVYGSQVVPITAAIAPYALSRRRMIDAVLEWAAASSPERRIAIAAEVRGHDRFAALSAHSYSGLLTETDFVTGVIEARGSLYTAVVRGRRLDPAKPYADPRVHVFSINRPLLEALAIKFGGWLRIVRPEGRNVVIGGAPGTIVHESVEWSVGTRKAERILALIHPRARLRKEQIGIILRAARARRPH